MGIRSSMIAFALLIGCAWTPLCNAATVHFDPDGNATSISFLVFNNTSYDVTFSYGLYEDLFPDLQPQIVKFPDARPAAIAIAAALNAASASSVGPAIGPYDNFEINIPAGSFFPATNPASPNYLGDVFGVIVFGPARAQCVTTPWCDSALFGLSIDGTPGFWPVFARVPEPSTLALLGLGLAGLGFARRTR